MTPKGLSDGPVKGSAACWSAAAAEEGMTGPAELDSVNRMVVEAEIGLMLAVQDLDGFNGQVKMLNCLLCALLYIVIRDSFIVHSMPLSHPIISQLF